MLVNVSHECDGYNAYDEQMQMQMMFNSKSEFKNGHDSTKLPYVSAGNNWILEIRKILSVKECD